MIGFAKLVFKKKMTKRVCIRALRIKGGELINPKIQIVHDTKLADFIDQPHLLKEYGGEVDWKTDLRWWVDLFVQLFATLIKSYIAGCPKD